MKTLSKKAIIIIAIILFILGVFLFNMPVFIVDKDEAAVVMTFGKYTRTLGPGLNFILPFGIESKIKVPVKKVLKEEFGFQTTSFGTKSEFYRGPQELEEQRMISADLKIIQIEWIVQYKITDPVKYLFKVNEQTRTLREFSRVAMGQIVGDYLFDEIITIAKSEITFKMQEILQKMCDEVELGITITTVQLINVTPPKEVEAAYNEVLQALQEKDKIINEAKKEYNKRVIPVEGEAERMISQANGYKAERVSIAQGEAKYFNDLYNEYIKAPEVTKKRIYLETMSSILPNMKNVYIIDDKQRNLLPLLQLENTKIIDSTKQ